MRTYHFWERNKDYKTIHYLGSMKGRTYEEALQAYTTYVIIQSSGTVKFFPRNTYRLLKGMKFKPPTQASARYVKRLGYRPVIANSIWLRIDKEPPEFAP